MQQVGFSKLLPVRARLEVMRSATALLAAVSMLLSLARGDVATHASPTKPPPLLARTLPDVEAAMLQALVAVNLTDRLTWVAADTNGHLTIGWLVLLYPTNLADPVETLQSHAWDLVRTTLTAVPSLDEIHLTGLSRGTAPFGTYRHLVTFSAAISRTEFRAMEQSASPVQPFRRVSRVWFHPALLQVERHEPKEDWFPSGKPTRPVAPELAMRFSGTQSAQVRESQHRASGVTRGTLIEDKLYHGDHSLPLVALTFDDGPFPIYTTLLLDTLDRVHLTATFFLVGEQVEQYPFFAQAIGQAGHEIGNHTFHHLNLTQLSAQAVEGELRRTQDVIFAVTGQTPRYFRPPGGDYNDTVLRIARALGLITVFWTDNPGDYTNPGPRVLAEKTLANITNGGIILLHQGVGDTIRILPQIAEALRQRRLTLAPVSRLLAPGKSRGGGR
jgi:peptidoglycan/xylan/chitin deacetylase (PgdA/CDA1 family)